MSDAVVLIVGAESGGRETLAAMLAGDHTVALAGDAAEALRRGVELMPDVILIEGTAPGLDGLDVCRRLRADARLAGVPVLAIVPRDARAACVRAGADDFVAAPWDDLDLRARLRAFTRLVRSEREVGAPAALATRLRERSAELEAVNAELAAFASAVSHDLRAPLRAVDAFARALREDCATRLSEEERQYLERILVNTKRMEGQIGDLVRLARVARGALRRQPVDLGVVAETVIDTLRRQEPDRHVDVHLAPNLHAIADPGLTRALLEHLLGNAWKFTRHRARARIEVAAAPAPANAFVVADNGTGFDMASAERLFRPFHRLHRADEFEGSGVGLAIARRVVHRHGGRIWAEAAVEQGARFFFTLAPAPEWTAPAAEPFADGEGE